MHLLQRFYVYRVYISRAIRAGYKPDQTVLLACFLGDMCFRSADVRGMMLANTCVGRLFLGCAKRAGVWVST